MIWNRQIMKKRRKKCYRCVVFCATITQSYTPDGLCVHNFNISYYFFVCRFFFLLWNVFFLAHLFAHSHSLSFSLSRLILIHNQIHLAPFGFLQCVARPYKLNTQRFSYFIFSTQVISCKCFFFLQEGNDLRSKVEKKIKKKQTTKEKKNS